VMERDHGGGENWQSAATVEWLRRLDRLPSTVKVAVLDGQTRPGVALAAASAITTRRVHVVLLDSVSDVRNARLRGPRRQPELANARMDSWADYLRGQADALELPVIDTSDLTIVEATDRLEKAVRRLLRSGESAI
jgi:hypothetical protein